MRSIALAFTLALSFAGPAQALTEGLAPKMTERFLEIGLNDTPEREPNAPLNRIIEELANLGLNHQTDGRNLTLLLPSNLEKKCEKVPLLAFLAILPSQIPGNPLFHRDYSGDDLSLPRGTIKTKGNPALLDYIGADLLSSDGEQPIGIDDRAAIAELLTAIEYLSKHPEIQHGDLKFAFLFEPERFESKGFADLAYFIEAGKPGEIENESFNSSKMTISVYGREASPGQAKGKMINALPIAAEIVGRIPPGLLPEMSDKRKGFIYPFNLGGSVKKSTLSLLLDDFERDGLASKEALIRKAASEVQKRYPSAKITIETKPSTPNLRTFLQKEPDILRFAEEACRRVDLSPAFRSNRKISECAELSRRGLPTAGLFTGSFNSERHDEWIPVPGMVRSTDVIIELSRIWAKRTID